MAQTLTPAPLNQQWQFWIDRGGTFTDIVAQRPDGSLQVHKLLSEHPSRYSDAVLQGIRDCLGLTTDQPLPLDQIKQVKMGTTVATNALLERQGEPTLLAITQGFQDILRIGYQNRPDIFALAIHLPDMLYTQVIEIPERVSAQGQVLVEIDPAVTYQALQAVYDQGFRAIAIVLLHGYHYPAHEHIVAQMAHEIGFTQISTSHEVSPLMKVVSRGDTTVVDAYLSPILRRYIRQLTRELDPSRLWLMQSQGGLAKADFFRGKDSLLSGPAGGVMGAVKTSQLAGFDKIIGFDMGGTSTDVSHYNGEYERTFETEVAGVRIRAPMLSIHTIAAGGGSILRFDGARYRVGPESAGAFPGPVSYRHGGPLTITDANLMVGKLQPAFFPAIFGPQGDLPLDQAAVTRQFETLATDITTATGSARTALEVAEGFLHIAVLQMANAIKKISTQRGYNVAEYTLCCFGGAGGQHACALAQSLGIQTVILHPYAGVLSAYGMGLADLSAIREHSIEAPLELPSLDEMQKHQAQCALEAQHDLLKQGVPVTEITLVPKVRLKYEGTDVPLLVDSSDLQSMTAQFEAQHQQRYGFIMAHKRLWIESIFVEAISQTPVPTPPSAPTTQLNPLDPVATVRLYLNGRHHSAPVYQRETLQVGHSLTGPALIIETTGTVVIEPYWSAHIDDHLNLILKAQPRTPEFQQQPSLSQQPDPVWLEIFNHLFQAVAEAMGSILQNTSYSINIKERLDFSCAVFDATGHLVANAPHIPVHLGSMSDSVQSLIQAKHHQLQPGDVYALNNPYNGGTHLPDITVITPVFASDGQQIGFYVASRGHHADIGGITPGSMPPHSHSILEEGILIDHSLVVTQGAFQEDEVHRLLTSGPYPARNPTQNCADLQAQIAANNRGVQDLNALIKTFGLATVQAYMTYVQQNAEACVRQAIARLISQGFYSQAYCYPLDDGSQIQVQVTLDASTHSACIDFTGTSAQQPSNFNTPLAVTKAAVLYVFRTLVDDQIPLNAGCLKPLTIITPSGSLLNPEAPAAVVAGNVETSQAIVNALYAALGVMAAAQGTMNNLTFGTDQYQYYETICGGSGAGSTFAGTDAVHTHMTNSRITDPEVLESRYPVLIETFQIRQGSGGRGQYPGGNGVIRQLKCLDPMTVAILSSHRQVAPPGLQGGSTGQVGVNQVIRADGSIEDLASCDQVKMAPGDSIVIATPGGGGFGQSGETVCVDALH